MAIMERACNYIISARETLGVCFSWGWQHAGLVITVHHNSCSDCVHSHSFPRSVLLQCEAPHPAPVCACVPGACVPAVPCVHTQGARGCYCPPVARVARVSLSCMHTVAWVAEEKCSLLPPPPPHSLPPHHHHHHLTPCRLGRARVRANRDDLLQHWPPPALQHISVYRRRRRHRGQHRRPNRPCRHRFGETSQQALCQTH